jgi:uncharacterized BrkB/YihY/UPF0761 family membrane protein
MTIRKLPLGTRIIFILLVSASITGLFFLIYSLVYSGPDSIYKKNAVFISIAFVTATRTSISYYKSNIAKRSA